MVLQSEYKISKDLVWLADGYKQKLNVSRDSMLPCDTDSFTLMPGDDSHQNSYAERLVETPEPIASHQVRIRSAPHHNHLRQGRQRPGTAPVARTRVVCWRESDDQSQENMSVTGSRPPSASGMSSRPPSGRRIKSAGSISARQKALDNMRKGFTLVNRLYEKDIYKRNINLHPVSPAPDYRYFDRHSRCHNHNHMHDDLLFERPQTACDNVPCSGYPRPPSAASTSSRRSRVVDPETMHQPARYINYHRPKTAPTTRNELRNLPRSHYLYGRVVGRSVGFHHSSIFRGRQPRFCNIVQQVQLHAKETRAPSPTRYPDDDPDYDDVDYLQRSIDEGRLIGSRKQSDARTPTGTEARPSSPSSTEGTTRIDVDISTLVGETTKEEEQIPSPELFIPSGADSDHDGSKQDTEPTQPPPTPEILTPKELPVVEPPKTPPKKSRACINKKTKQPITRVKKQKETKMEEKQEEVKPPTPPQTPPLHELSDEKDIKVEIALPDLPTFKEKEATTHKGKRKERHALVIPKNVKPKEELEELLDVPLAQKLKEFDWSGMETQNSDDSPRKTQKAEWVTGRLALSQQSSRFELPMDMRVLETISPQEYLRQFCKITKRRQKLYSDVFRRFQKSKDRNAPYIPYSNLEKALMSVLVSTLTSEHFAEMCELTAINQETEVDVDLFSSLAALEERLLYKGFVTPETLGMPDYKKEKVECADFSALEWKFKGINVNPPVYKLLKQLAEDT